MSKLETNDDLIRFASIAVLKWEQCAAKLNALRLFFGIDKNEVNLVEDDPVASEPHWRELIVLLPVQVTNYSRWLLVPRQRGGDSKEPRVIA